MCPFDLRIVQGFLRILLFPLVVDESLLHLSESVSHLIVLTRLLGAWLTILLAKHDE